MTPPLPLYQNPPTLAESAQPVAVDMAQLCAMLVGVTAAMQGMKEEIKNNTNKMEANVNGMKQEMNGNARQMENKMESNTNQMKEETKGMREEMKEMRGEMQNMGAGLQDGLERLKIGNGELRRATCWGRRVEVTEKVTETVTQTLKGEETTCTRETRRQVTEYTETREIGERLRGVEEEGDARSHTHTGSEGQWG